MVAKEYSKALYELAEELNIIDLIKEQFSNFNIILKDKEMYGFFTSPVIKSNDKKEVLKKSLVGFNENFIHFLYVLIDNNRFDLLNEIYNEYININLNKNNIVSIKLYSAEKLSEKHINNILDSLKSRFNNKKIIYENIVDESLIGGIRVLANDTEININPKTIIHDLKNSL